MAPPLGSTRVNFTLIEVIGGATLLRVLLRPHDPSMRNG
jgi:hypothetical protein